MGVQEFFRDSCRSWLKDQNVFGLNVMNYLKIRLQFCPIPNKNNIIAVSWRKIRRNEFWKANEFWKMFLLDKAKSFVVIYLHYNSDIIFWISKKKEILRGSQPKFLQRKSAGGIKRSLKKSIRFHNFII